MKMVNVFALSLSLGAPAGAAVVSIAPARLLPLGAPSVGASALGAFRSPAPLSAALQIPAALPVPAAPAVAARPFPAAAAASSSDPSMPAEAQSARQAAAFDGSAAVSRAQPVAVAALSYGLRAMNPADGEWLDSVISELARTRTGRGVLRRLSSLIAGQGFPIIVDISALSNNAEFRYDSNILVMDETLRRGDPARVAPLMAHEFQHILQWKIGLPTDALELEIESYVVESRVWNELGVEPARGSFAAQARRHLLRGLEDFVPWLANEYKHNFSLYGHSMKEFVYWQIDRRENILKRIARAEKEIERVERAILVMRSSGMPEEAVAAFALEALEPALRRLKVAQGDLVWSDRDVARLGTPEGRALFRRYVRGVMRRARSLTR